MIIWHSKIAETQGNLGRRAESGESMYHFYLQLEGQPAQFSQEEDRLKRVTCSRIVSEPIEKNGHLTCFAEYAVIISTFFDTQDSFQEAQLKEMYGDIF